jgi:SAM-dependent MidA family methyltransferase
MEFLEVFRTHADVGRTMPFVRFMDLALYHPATGYYRRNAKRIGRAPQTDFFTATSSGSPYGQLVCASCLTLLGGRNPREFHFVEIGAEEDGGILRGLAHPFASQRTIAIGEPIELSGNCIVFSNELFDAQPFRRFVFRRGQWRELGVTLHNDELNEVELSNDPPGNLLPVTAPDGYVIDAPMATAELGSQIASKSWSGIFVAADYGKSWREITEATPQGTARAYFRHTQSNGLLDRPGEQDLTCHICWDWLVTEFARHGFESITVESQESFFVRRASEFIARTIGEDAGRFSARKQSLQQLLHPSHLGQKFQVLSAVRFPG